jgi:hypothetical protein
VMPACQGARPPQKARRAYSPHPSPVKGGVSGGTRSRFGDSVASSIPPTRREERLSGAILDRNPTSLPLDIFLVKWSAQTPFGAGRPLRHRGLARAGREE